MESITVERLMQQNLPPLQKKRLGFAPVESATDIISAFLIDYDSLYEEVLTSVTLGIVVPMRNQWNSYVRGSRMITPPRPMLDKTTRFVTGVAREMAIHRNRMKQVRIINKMVFVSPQQVLTWNSHHNENKWRTTLMQMICRDLPVPPVFFAGLIGLELVDIDGDED